MAERDDPPFIHSLLDPLTEHSCYFRVGDPVSGDVERIGVVSAMLMAHSLVLRRVLSSQETDLDERWDIPITDMQPHTFRNMLKYAYGFNNIRSHSVGDSVELLKVAARLVMTPLQEEVVKHLSEILTPANVCLALQSSHCLRHSYIEMHIAKAVQTGTATVLSSENFDLISSAGLRYIVLLGQLQVSEADVWRAVIKWARHRVLKENLSSSEGVSRLESYVCPQLIVPSLRHIKLCSLNIIRLVEMSGADHTAMDQVFRVLSKYHFVSKNTSKEVFICSSSDESRIRHERFDLRVVHDCSSWIDAIAQTTSEMIINTTASSMELYCIVCTGSRRQRGELVDVNVQRDVIEEHVYECECTVIMTQIKKPEEGNNEDKEALISEINFKEQIMFGEEFQILLHCKGKRLKLQPNSSYKIETRFSSPHPLWYANEIEYFSPNRISGLDIGCGLVNKTYLWYGSHVRSLLYRTCTT